MVYTRKRLNSRRKLRRTYKRRSYKNSKSMIRMRRKEHTISDKSVKIPRLVSNLPMPERLLTKMRTTLDLILPSGSQGYNYSVIPMNGLIGSFWCLTGLGATNTLAYNRWAPGQTENPSTVPGYPLGFRYLLPDPATFNSDVGYKNFKVHASKIEFIAKPAGLTDNGTFYVAPCSSKTQYPNFASPTADAVSNFRNSPGAVVADFSSNYTLKNNTISSYQECHSIEGLTKKEYNAEQNYAGNYDNNPQTVGIGPYMNYWVVGWYKDTLSTINATSGITFRINVEYLVECYQFSTSPQQQS